MTEYIPFLGASTKLDFQHIKDYIAGFCHSPVGKERLQHLVPSTLRGEIIDELARAEEIHRLRLAEDPPPLETLPDVRETLHRASIEGSVLQGTELLGVLLLLRMSRRISTFFAKHKDDAPLTAGLMASLFVDKMVEYHIERVLDEEGNVKDSASKDLRRLRLELIEKSAQLRRRMEHILKRVSDDHLVQEELVTLRDGRMVLPVKREYKRQIQGFIHSESATGLTVYIEPTETLDLNNDIRDLQFEEAREVQKLLSELTSRVRPHVSELLQATVLYAELDSLWARVTYMQTNGASIPRVSPGRNLAIESARHPILLIVKKQQGVVPLTLSIPEDISAVVITGPNAGGKSVAMKTVGLLALMVQAGIPVPCDESSAFPVYTDVFVDIGDEQSVENDLSTFSSHVQRLAEIIDRADEKSLVLIDEIGTGTDPTEGSALGAAILDELANRRTHLIATTHHGMLKAFAHEHPRMQNAAMEFDLATLQPTYRYHAGLPGSSYAFEITRRHGLRPDVIESARTLLGSRSDALEKLLSEVEQRSQELGGKIRELALEKEHYDALVESYESRMKGLKQEITETKKRALEEAESVLRDANALIEQTVRDIREQQASKESIRAAKDELQALQQSIEKASAELEPLEKTLASAEPFHADEIVVMKSNPSVTGKVLEEPADGKAVVAFGSLKMKLDVHELRHAKHVSQTPVAPEQLPEKSARTEIDVRGLYGDEAVKEIDSFLYDAYSSGLKRVDIIHGKGTGALRKRVQEFLRTSSLVESFRLGEWNEGSTGVTVAFLKD